MPGGLGDRLFLKIVYYQRPQRRLCAGFPKGAVVPTIWNKRSTRKRKRKAATGGKWGVKDGPEKWVHLQVVILLAYATNREDTPFCSSTSFAQSPGEGGGHPSVSDANYSLPPRHLNVDRRPLGGGRVLGGVPVRAVTRGGGGRAPPNVDCESLTPT